MDVGAWLRGLGLEEYAEAFAENGIDAVLLPELTNEDLKDLGVARLADRKRLLKAIAGISEGDGKGETQPSPSTPSEGERRQVTVLFADLAGFTQLSGELGAEATHALLNRYFEAVDAIVEGYGGSIDKHIGDNVMALFGAPVAHADDPERALRAALDIHRTMPDLSAEFGRPLQAHIGIASGQVVASGTGSEAHREYTVTGNSVNLASRLQDKAKAGETLISQAVHRAVTVLAESAPMGEIEVKGFEAPVPVWRLEGLRSDAAARRNPFVGRRAERRQFAALIQDCLETGNGQAILARGEAGIGKTRLVEEFAALAEASGFASHKGLVLDFGVGKGQDAVLAVVRSLLGLAGGGAKAARAAATDRAVEAGWLEADARVFLNDLLDLPQPLELRALYDAMDNATRNGGKQAAVADLVRGSSATQPILVTVEDVHWADPLTLAHLAGIAATVADCPAVLVMTSRVEGDPLDQAWRASLGGSPLATMDLQPLRAAEAEELAGGFVETGSAFVHDCIERAEGNPLFLEQLLRNAEEGALTEVPGSIQSLVLARMDRLEPRDKQALQAASVIGQRFAPDALRSLLEDSAYDCKALVEHYLVRPEGDGYLFAHALIQEGVYSSLLQARKRALHRRAANWFADHDAVLYAEHLDRAEDPSAPRAYLEAARALSIDYRFEQAGELAQRGSDLAADPETEYELVCLKGDTFRELGTIDESIAAFERALAIAAEDEVRKTRAWVGLAAGTRLAERYEDALEALDKAQGTARDHDLTESLADIHYQRAGLHFRLGEIDECLAQSELALKFARQAASPEHEARALSVLGDAYYMRGRMITAHDHYRRCLEQARKHGFGRIEVANLHMRGLTRYFQNDLHGALDDSRAAVQAAARTGHHRAEMIARGMLAGLLLDMGDPDGAEENFTVALTLAQRLGARSYEPFSFVNLGKIRCLKGDRSEGLHLVEQAVAISREVGLKTSGPRALGALALVTDDPDTRNRALREGEEVLREGCISHHYFSFYRDAMEACLHIGDWDQAERYAAALEDYTRPEPLPLADLFIARGRAIAAWSRGARDDARARELRRLRAEAERIGLKTALPALDAALKAA